MARGVPATTSVGAVIPSARQNIRSATVGQATIGYTLSRLGVQFPEAPCLAAHAGRRLKPWRKSGRPVLQCRSSIHMLESEAFTKDALTKGGRGPTDSDLLVWLEPEVSVLVGRPLGGFLVPTESRVHV